MRSFVFWGEAFVSEDEEERANPFTFAKVVFANTFIEFWMDEIKFVIIFDFVHKLQKTFLNTVYYFWDHIRKCYHITFVGSRE